MTKALIFIFEVSILTFLGFIYSELYLLRAARNEAAELHLAVSPGGSADQDNSSVSWLELGNGEPAVNYDRVMPEMEQTEPTIQASDRVDTETAITTPVETNND